MDLPLGQIVLGDCREVMAEWPDNCIDAIVTDPPYGLEFMGKEWDKLAADPVSKSWNTKGRTMTGAPRRAAATPGGRHAAQVYKSPNPRCSICGRAIQGNDTAKGFKVCHCPEPSIYLPNTYAVKAQTWHHLWAREAFRVLKPGGHLLAFGGTRTYHRMACAVEDAGFEIRDQMQWLYGSGFPKSLDVSKAIDKAAGAKQWSGWGTALKPAHEPLVLARKPLSEKNVAANVLKWGTGGLNVDGCRIGTEARHNRPVGAHVNAMMPYEGKCGPGTDVVGRWPANLLFDEEAAAMLDEQSGERKSGTLDFSHHQAKERRGACYGGEPNVQTRTGQYGGDSGGASRFFYCAKASRKERGEGNNHPTVKPIKLMRYLCRLITPPDGIVLDPFCGSGSTCIAAREEGFAFVGIDNDPESVEIARARVGEQAKQAMCEA